MFQTGPGHNLLSSGWLAKSHLIPLLPIFHPWEVTFSLFYPLPPKLQSLSNTKKMTLLGLQYHVISSKLFYCHLYCSHTAIHVWSNEQLMNTKAMCRWPLPRTNVGDQHYPGATFLVHCTIILSLASQSQLFNGDLGSWFSPPRYAFLNHLILLVFGCYSKWIKLCHLSILHSSLNSFFSKCFWFTVWF